MKISLEWLKKFISIDDSIVEIAEILSIIGLEAEVSSIPTQLPGVIVAYVEKTSKHPNAEKLQICTINDGTKSHQVICGAPNIKSGQKIAFATVGSILPDNFKIKKANIRGIDSFGMVCSEKELNITDEHEGIMILPKGLNTGDDFMTAYGYKFISVELDITPNRSDAFSYLGVARDLACYKKIPLKIIKEKKLKSSGSEKISIVVEDIIDCPRYVVGIVNNIKIDKSPDWMIERLKASGLRSINNVVDISNYVLLETGQPSHIFDFNNIKRKGIEVRRANKKETLKTLDGNEHLLKPENLLITDGKVPIALAGIMGGLGTSVNPKTTSVLVECAFFNAVTIRKSSKVLGLSTDASKRFERGTDPNACIPVFWRIIELLNELANGDLISTIMEEYPKKIIQPTILIRKKEISSTLGVNISKNEIEDIFKGLEIKFKNIEDGWSCIPPSFRPDLTREIDLIEEIARIFGYDTIPIDNSINGSFRYSNPDPENNYDLIRTYFSGLGFYQIYSNSLQSEIESNKAGYNPVKMLNPLNQDMGFLRTELLTGLINAAKFNIKHNARNFRLFELANVHFQEGSKLEDIKENKHLAGIIFGNRIEESVHGASMMEDIFSIKGILNFIFEKKFNGKLEFSKNSYSLFDQTYSIQINRQEVGFLGHISREQTKGLKVNLESLYGFEINLEPIKKMLNGKKKFKKINLFPEIQRDLNLVLPTNLQTGKIVKLIMKIGKKIIKSVTPVNIFSDSNILGDNMKSITFSIIFQHPSKTLEDTDVNPIINEIIHVAEKDFLAKLRV